MKIMKIQSNRKYLISLLHQFAGRVFFNEDLIEMSFVFSDRENGGKALAELISFLNLTNELNLVLAIPCGGVPVGFVVAKMLGIKLDLLIIRKILIPWNTEAGYGAVDPDGNYIIDEDLRKYLGFTDEDVKEHVRTTFNEVLRREALFRNERSYSHINEKKVLIVDDGIASGYTMLAAINFVKRHGAKSVLIGAPTASLSSIRLLYKDADAIIVPNIRSGFPYFAVADAYILWYDLSDDEVLKLIRLAEKEKLLFFTDENDC